MTADIPENLRRMVEARVGKAMPMGNEGAGVVVAAGSSDAAQALLGRTVATIGGGMYAQFRVASADLRHERYELECEVVAATTHREFVGFHRARHALLEAAILATRFHLLSADEIEREFDKLAQIIGKTGDEPEKSAMAELDAAFDRFRAGVASP